MEPIRLTKAEYQKKFGVAPVVSTSTLDTTPAPIRITRAEYEAMFAQPQAPTNRVQETAQDYREYGSALKSTVEKGAMEQGRIRDRMKSGEVSTAKGLFQRFGKGLETTANLVFDTAIAGAKQFTSQDTEDKVKTFFTKYSEALGDRTSEMYQKEVTSKLTSDDPNERKAAQVIDETVRAYQTDETFRTDVESAGGILSWLFVPERGAAAAQKIGDAVTPPLSDVSKQISQKVSQFAVRNEDKAVKGVADEILNIENKNKPTRVANSVDKDADASRLRIAQSNVLENAVDSNGVINSLEAAKVYAKETIDGFEDVVRRELELEARNINLNELADELRLAISSSNLEGADLAAAFSGIKRELAGLRRRADAFGNIDLAKIHDAKISTTKHIDYTKPTGITYRKTIASVYKQIIEDKSSLPIKAVNSELGKFYNDIERIKRLDGKRVEGGRLGKYTASLTGTAIGGVAGAAGGWAGAAIGGAIGGEAASFLKGRSMAGTFARGIDGKTPGSQILKDAKARADAGARDLSKPNKPVGAPKQVLQKATPEQKKAVARIEGQIKKNVEQQKKAIKAGDFGLVEQLQGVYDILVIKLKKLIDEIIESAKNPSIGLSIRKTVTPASVAKKADKADIRRLASVIDDPELAKADPDTMRMLNEMGLGRATNEELVSFAKEVIDEVDGVAERAVVETNPS